MALLRMKQINGGLELQADVKELVKILGSSVENGTAVGNKNGASLIKTTLEVQTDLKTYLELNEEHFTDINDKYVGITKCYLTSDSEQTSIQKDDVKNITENQQNYTVVANVVYSVSDIIQLLHNADDELRQKINALDSIAVPMVHRVSVAVTETSAEGSQVNFNTKILPDTVMDAPKMQIIVNNLIYNEGVDFARGTYDLEETIEGAQVTTKYLQIIWDPTDNGAGFALNTSIANEIHLMYYTATTRTLATNNITFHDGTSLIFE